MAVRKVGSPARARGLVEGVEAAEVTRDGLVQPRRVRPEGAVGEQQAWEESTLLYSPSYNSSYNSPFK